MRKFKIKSHGYTVIAPQEIISQLFTNELNIMAGKITYVINWFNFKEGIAYYDNNGERYIVSEIDHVNKTVKLV